jgi:hypothetical protein
MRPFALELATLGEPRVLERAAPDLWLARSHLGSAAQVAALLRPLPRGSTTTTSSGSRSSNRKLAREDVEEKGTVLAGAFRHMPGRGATFGPFFDAARPFAKLATVQPRSPYAANATLSRADFLRVFGGQASTSGADDLATAGRPGEGLGRLGGAWAYSGALGEALGDDAEDR